MVWHLIGMVHIQMKSDKKKYIVWCVWQNLNIARTNFFTPTVIWTHHMMRLLTVAIFIQKIMLQNSLTKQYHFTLKKTISFEYSSKSILNCYELIISSCKIALNSQVRTVLLQRLKIWLIFLSEKWGALIPKW